MDTNSSQHINNMSIISPDINGNMDGSVLRIAQHINSPYPIVPITRIEGFVFNPELLKLDKWILLDYSELWWNSENTDTHLFGRNTEDFPQQFPGDEWKKFDDFVREQPPVIYFKRELLNKDRSDFVHPIDYPCWVELPPIQTKEEFNNRLIEVFYFWGRSHEERCRLHSSVWSNSSRNGASICDNIYQYQQFIQEESNPKKWVTLYMPHYSRIDISHLLAINGQSKLSVSLFGAGRKCFRTTGESPVNSLMVMQKSEACYTYKWEHGVNCLMFPQTEVDVTLLDEFLKRDDLWEIYCKGVETVQKYKITNYLNDYIHPLLNK